jgi:Zn-dependent peptidase ImmA (M78 family)/DNA-binding XRE family transcriptional regulator
MQNLAQAREDAGYSQEDVAAALGVHRVMVSYWETGQRTPNDRQLAALARLYGLTISQLAGTEPLPVRADPAQMLFRGTDDELSGEAKRGLREFVAFLDSYAALAEAARVDIQGLRQSPFLLGAGYDTAEDARRKAEEVRSHLRLGLGAISDMDAVAELLGITVFRAALGSDLKQAISGAFLDHKKVGFSILVNIEMTPGRRRFTMAHEVAHALFHSRERYVVSRPTGSPKERFADLFAGEFLMPTEGIRRVMEELRVGPRITTAAEVIHLQRYFNVSYWSALVRLLRAKLITRAQFDDFENVRPVLMAQALGYEVGEEEFGQDKNQWRTRRFPRRFINLLRQAVATHVVSPATAATLTGLALDDIEELIADRRSPSPDPEGSRELDEYRDSGVLVGH